MNANQLCILQYNVRKEKNRMMAPLLQSNVVEPVDIIAIQEPWQNPHCQTTFNPQDSNFHLTFTPTDHTRICFYINKRIATASWKVDRIGHPNATTLMIQLLCGTTPIQLQVHNIYSQSPAPSGNHRHTGNCGAVSPTARKLRGSPHSPR